MPRCRPFRLVDAIILIAAAAVAMAPMYAVWNQLHRWKVEMDIEEGLPWQIYAGSVHTGLNIALLMLAVAYVVMRLIPPRPPRSDLIRQPGMLFLGLLIGLGLVLFLFVALSAFVPLVAGTNMIIALVLGLSWGAACRRYRSRAEPGWIEGLGRTVGVGLVVSIAVTYPLYLLAA